MDTTIKATKACIRAFITKNSSNKTDPTAVKTSVNVLTTYCLVNNLNGAGDHTVQWLIDIDHQYIVFIRTRFFQRFKLGHQHLRFEEVAFTRFQAAFDNVKIPFQIDEREVRVTVA